MLANSLLPSSDSVLHQNISSINSDVLQHFNMLKYINCLISRPSSFIFTSFLITFIVLLLPLCIFIIYHGLQQWRLNGSTSSAATMSHSDSFTYNMVAMETIGVFGSVLSICGIYSNHLNTLSAGFCLSYFTWFGQMYFHVLTCVERYLAVVHPITYLSLRKERGIRIRNISITCVWLMCFAGTVLLMKEIVLIILYFCLLTSSLVIVSSCSISVLCVLIGPGPGEQGRGRKRVDQSKQRAFYTIMVILGVLVLRFSWNLVLSALYVLEGGPECVRASIGYWLNLPCSLVLPLLFLHRAGKSVCWKKNIH